MIKDIQKLQRELESKYLSMVPLVDKAAQDLYAKDPAAARELLTNYSCDAGDATVAAWKRLGEYLLVKYHDGNIKKEKDGKFEENGYGLPVMPSQPGYPEWWLKEIVREHGEKVKVIGSAH